MRKLKTRFSDFKIKTKLGIVIGIFMLSLVLMGIIANFLFRSSQTLTIIVNEQRVFIEKFYQGIEKFHEYEISGEQKDLENTYANFNEAVKIAYTFSAIDSIMQTMHKEEWLPLMYDVFKEGLDYDIERAEMMGVQILLFSKINKQKLSEIQANAVDAYKLGNTIVSEIENYTLQKTPEKRQQIESHFLQIKEINQLFASKIFAFNDYVARSLVRLLALLVTVLIIAIAFISGRISKSISDPLKMLAGNFKEIAAGNLNASVNIATRNELGELSKAFRGIQIRLQEIISHSKKVAEGDYSVRLNQKSKKDDLTPALNKMAARLEESSLYAKRENWLQNGISRLDDKMRGNYPVRELSDRIINYLCDFLAIEMGAVYVFDEVLEHLELTGSLGVDVESVKEEIQVGEGLVGKAALDEGLRIIETKSKYHKVYSATGEIFPGKIYFLPLHYSNRIQAVIELAPVNELTEIKIEFLNLIKERISVNLSAAVARYRSNELL
ncbi:MAG: HAMP domain-containing protein, partial [Bacteroidota bacterium]